MKRAVLFLMMFLSGLFASAATYNVTIDDFDFDISSNNSSIDITSQIGDLLQTGDKVIVTVDGYFNYSVNVTLNCIADNSEAASYWKMLSNFESADLGSATVGTKFSESYEFTLTEDAVTTDKYIVQVAIGFSSILGKKQCQENGGIVTLRPTDEPDPEGETYTIDITSTVFSNDVNGSNYMAQFPFVTESTTLKKNDKVVVTFDGSFSQDMNGINFMIFDGNGNEVMAWAAKSLYAPANEPVKTEYEFNIKNNCSTETYQLGVFVEGYDENVILKFTTADDAQYVKVFSLPYNVYGERVDDDNISDQWSTENSVEYNLELTNAVFEETGNTSWSPSVGETFVVSMSGVANFSGTMKIRLVDTRDVVSYWGELTPSNLEEITVSEGEEFTIEEVLTIIKDTKNGESLTSPQLYIECYPTLTSTMEGFDNTKIMKLNLSEYSVTYQPAPTYAKVLETDYNEYSSDRDDDGEKDDWQGTFEQEFVAATGASSFTPAFGDSFSFKMKGFANFSGEMAFYMVDDSPEANYWLSFTDDLETIKVQEGEEYTIEREFVVSRLEKDGYTLKNPHFVIECYPDLTSSMYGFTVDKKTFYATEYSMEYTPANFVKTLDLLYIAYGKDTDGDNISDEWQGNYPNEFLNAVVEANGNTEWKPSLGEKFTITMEGFADFTGDLSLDMIDTRSNVEYWAEFADYGDSFRVKKGTTFTIQRVIEVAYLDKLGIALQDPYFVIGCEADVTSTKSNFDEGQIKHLYLTKYSIEYESASQNTDEFEYLGGPMSVHGSFYTADNGVQTKVQLGEDGSQVLFCLGSDSKGYYLVSGTKTLNEIVSNTAAETRFSVTTDGDDNDFNYASHKVYVTVGATYGFKNKNAQGTIAVVDFNVATDDVKVKVELEAGTGEDFSDKLVYLGGVTSTIGSFFTADKGVQTKNQLGDDASKVVFLYTAGDDNYIISGTESANEIVSSQASETKFATLTEASISAFEALGDTDFSATRIAVEKGSLVAFKNMYAKGFFRVGNIDEDLQMKMYVEVENIEPGDYEYLGGPMSVHGSFYTADNGVQTKVQLGEDGSQVLFCLGSDSKGYYLVSGTKTLNEIVSNTAAETRFSVTTDGDDNDFNYASHKVYVTVGATYGFKNKNAQGTIAVVDFNVATDDVKVKVELEAGTGEDFSDELVYLGGAKSVHGGFYTADKGVQTKAQLGDDASQVVFCLYMTDDNPYVISGTESANEIVSSQASETKFAAMPNAKIETYNNLRAFNYTSTSISITEGSVYAFTNNHASGFFTVGNIDTETQDVSLLIYKEEGVVKVFETSYVDLSSSIDVDNDGVSDQWGENFDEFTPVAHAAGVENWQPSIGDKFTVRMAGVANFTGYVQLYMVDVREEVGWFKEFSTSPERFYVKNGERFDFEREFVVKTKEANNVTMIDPKLNIVCVGAPLSSHDDFDNTVKKTLSLTKYEMKYVPFVQELVATWDSYTGNDTDLDGISDLWNGNKYFEQVAQIGDSYEFKMSGVSSFTGKVKFWMINWGPNGQTWNEIAQSPSPAFDVTEGEEFNFEWTFDVAKDAWEVSGGAGTAFHYQFMPSATSTKAGFDNSVELKLFMKEYTQTYVPREWVQEGYVYINSLYSDVLKVYLPNSTVLSSTYGSPITYKVVSSNSSVPAYISNDTLYIKSTENDMGQNIEVQIKGTIENGSTATGIISVFAEDLYWEYKSVRANDTLALYVPNEYLFSRAHVTAEEITSYQVLYGETDVPLYFSNDTLYAMPTKDHIDKSIDVVIKGFCDNGSVIGEKLTLYIEHDSIVPNPKIALVTVSQTTGKNLVVWQKFDTDKIDHYNIYREGEVAGKYEKIAEVPYSETSVYEDLEADPVVQPWRYGITATPTDDRYSETEMISVHKTLHLQQNQGLGGVINLSWNEYKGIDYSTYKIIRKSVVRNVETIDTIATIPSNLTTYTDIKPAKGTQAYYVAIELPQTIDPNVLLKSENGPFSLAISNIAEVESDPTAIANVQDSNVEIRVEGRVITILNAESGAKLYDVSGRFVAASESLPVQRIDVKKAGIYFVKVGNGVSKVILK